MSARQRLVELLGDLLDADTEEVADLLDAFEDLVIEKVRALDATEDGESR